MAGRGEVRISKREELPAAIIILASFLVTFMGGFRSQSKKPQPINRVAAEGAV